MPGAIAQKPGSATLPLPGVKPVLVDAEGEILEGAVEGNLCITDSWPGQARTLYGDHSRFEQTYFSTFPGKYFTGDGARRDADGYFWITGRVDDVINVSGHRMGTAEVEAALNAHHGVTESAVVGFPHDLKGQGIYAYVTLVSGHAPSDTLKHELVAWVRRQIGPIATPDVIQFAPNLPKTRSGKIMRRILRKIAANELDGLGDTSHAGRPGGGGRPDRQPTLSCAPRERPKGSGISRSSYGLGDKLSADDEWVSGGAFAIDRSSAKRVGIKIISPLLDKLVPERGFRPFVLLYREGCRA